MNQADLYIELSCLCKQYGARFVLSAIQDAYDALHDMSELEHQRKQCTVISLLLKGAQESSDGLDLAESLALLADTMHANAEDRDMLYSFTAEDLAEWGRRAQRPRSELLTDEQHLVPPAER